MKTFINNLIEYNFHTNNKMIDSLLTNEDKLSEKTIDLMSHTLRAHEIWLNRLNSTDVVLKVWERIEIDRFVDLNNTLFNQTIEIIKSKDFNSITSYKNSKGERFDNTVLDILFHVINHSNYHRGQINTELKKSGIEPILTDYIFYKR